MKLMLVDGSNIAMRCSFGGGIQPEQSTPTATNMIDRCARQFGATHLVVALDCPSSVPSWRKLEYPAYKANRDKDNTCWMEAAHMAWSKRGWWVEAVNGFEADDVLATLARRASSRCDVVVVSGDSDLIPLMSDTVQVVKPVNGGTFEVITAKYVAKKFQLEAKHLTAMKAMAGESGDNVPGVPTIGPVRAAKLLTQYGSLDAILDAGSRSVCPQSVKVWASRDVVALALRLVTLRLDVPTEPITPAGCAFSSGQP